jgi:hypothetical protein
MHARPAKMTNDMTHFGRNCADIEAGLRIRFFAYVSMSEKWSAGCAPAFAVARVLAHKTVEVPRHETDPRGHDRSVANDEI